ncbi:MAG: hypothetical protein ACREQ9_10650, partial [Candidatus Binatia bacterium]
MSAEASRAAGLRWGAPVFVFVLAVVALAPAFRDGYVLDDVAQVYHLRLPPPTLAGWVDAATYPWWSRARQWTAWRPVTRLAILAEKSAVARIGTREPWPYRVASIALHGIACVLVAVLARTLGFAWPAAGAAGAILAVHPLRSEPVHQIVGQGELLVAVLLAAGAALYVRARSRGWRWPAIALTQAVCYAVALGAKEHAVVYPAYLALVEAAIGRE